MNIHIALVGKTEGAIISGIHQYGAVDEIYLLHSEGTETVAKSIQSRIKPLGIRKIVLRMVDAFSMHSIVEAILDIAKDKTPNDLFINITGGTNLMAGAATAASFFVGAQAYYIRDPDKLPKNSPSKDMLIELPVPNIPYHTSLEDTQRDILQLFTVRNEKIINKIIQYELNLSPQTVSYHVKELQRKKLITSVVDPMDSRKKFLSLTNSGRLVVKWTKAQK